MVQIPQGGLIIMNDISVSEHEIEQTKALRICVRHSPCPKVCPRYKGLETREECARRIMEISADTIERQQYENVVLRGQVAGLTTERDAAVRDLKHNPCLSCMYNKMADECKQRIFGLGEDCHEWRGPCAENADAPEGAESEEP